MHLLQAMTLLAVPLLVASGKPGGPAGGSGKSGSSGHKGGSGSETVGIVIGTPTASPAATAPLGLLIPQGGNCASDQFWVPVTSTCAHCSPITGECQDSSCVVFGFANSAKANCAHNKCAPAYCSYYGEGCNQNSGKCFGLTLCSDGTTTCSGYGALCLQDGGSSNFKICGTSIMVAETPTPHSTDGNKPKHSPDHGGPKSTDGHKPQQSPDHGGSHSTDGHKPEQSPDHGAPHSTDGTKPKHSPDHGGPHSTAPQQSPDAGALLSTEGNKLQPSPAQGACISTNELYATKYMYADTPGCGPAFIQAISQLYNCSEITPFCGSYFCSIALPPAVATAVTQCELP